MTDHRFVKVETVHTGTHWLNVAYVVDVEEVSENCCRIHLDRTVDIMVLGGRAEKRSSLQVSQAASEVVDILADRIYP